MVFMQNLFPFLEILKMFLQRPSSFFLIRIVYLNMVCQFGMYHILVFARGIPRCVGQLGDVSYQYTWNPCSFANTPPQKVKKGALTSPRYCVTHVKHCYKIKCQTLGLWQFGVYAHFLKIHILVVQQFKMYSSSKCAAVHV